VSELILALDQGTSATKACVYEPPGRLRGSASIPVRRHSPAPGSVEQDPLELLESCRAAAAAALADAGASASDLRCAALANQGESFVLFDDAGTPLGPVVSWQDTRSGHVLERLDAEGHREPIERRTGLPLHAEFSAPKLAHRLAEAPLPAGSRFGTLDTWLIHGLHPAAPHVTDRATASRTMLIGLEDDDWSEDLLELFAVPYEILPTIVPCDDVGAQILVEGHELPLTVSSYDMGLALLGHACLDRGDLKATFGTCLGVMGATGPEAVEARGLLTTLAYTLGRSPAFALDGEIAAAGALFNWALRLGLAGSLDELEGLAASTTSSAGAVVVPAITGLGAPHWRDDAEGAIVGLTEAVGRAELAHAVFDAVAWSLSDVLAAMRAVGIEVDELRVDGGLTRSRLLLRRCADVCQTPLTIGAQREATAFGSAALAMLADGSATGGDLRAAARGTERVDPGAAPSDAEAEAWATAVAGVL